jgi:ribosomal protein S18 acetylase RimI-like enzyme
VSFFSPPCFQSVTAWAVVNATMVAHPKGYRDEIAGFVLSNGAAVCSLYVKNDYRRRGVARVLLDAAGVGTRLIAVLGSPKAFRLARAKGLEVQLSPYLI